MAVRSTMTALIDRTRLLINDPRGASQTFTDQDIQDVLDESRQDIGNVALQGVPTYSGVTIQYLDYYSELGGWEDGVLLKQNLTVTVTPSLKEPIVGHWAFTASTLPPVYITGSLHDVYRAAADVLERYAGKYMLNYDFSSDGQSFKRSQPFANIEKRIIMLRRQQRAGVIKANRADLAGPGAMTEPSLQPTAIDYMGSG